MAETTNEAPEPGRGREPQAETAPAVLHGRYEIHLERRLPAYGSRIATAYAATDRKGGRGNLMALVAEGMLPPRSDVLGALRGGECPGVMQPVRWGVVDLAAQGRRSFAVIYGQPAGGRVMESLSQDMAPMSEAQLMSAVIAPVVGALRDLGVRGLAHRAVRPDNMFYRDPASRQVMLGDAALVPAGASQPAVFETIESAVTHPLARGPGGPADDLYALGVSVVMLMFGGNPVANRDTDAVIAEKIDKGSYAALIGDQRVAPALREALRGLLADKTSERWTVDEVMLWLDGRRLSPLQPSTARRAFRPIIFHGEEYYSCESLAFAMSRNWDAAIGLIGEKGLENWVRRAVGDRDRADAVSEAVESGPAGGGRAGELALAARVCMALDPQAPIRYKDIAVTIPGLGPFFNELAASRETVQTFSEMIFSSLPTVWIARRFPDPASARPLVQLVERVRHLVRQAKPAAGIERCLYDLNESQPCLSPLVAAHYAVDAEDLLPALEAVAPSRPSTLPMDRHIAAFIASRFRHGTEDQLRDFAERGNPAAMALAVLKPLAVMQWRLGPDSLPGLTAWLGESMGPVIESFRSATVRERVRGRLDGVVRQGSLTDLLNLVDDPKLRRFDDNGFADAQAAYAAAEAEIARLGKGEDSLAEQAEQVASRLAVLVSGLVAVATVSVLFVLQVT